MFRQLLGTSMLVAAGAATLGDLPRPIGGAYLADSTQHTSAIEAGGGGATATLTDEQAIGAKLGRWEKLFGDRECRMTFAGFEDLYADPAGVAATAAYGQSGWSRYRLLREQGVAESFVEWRVSDVAPERIVVQGDSAWSTLRFRMREEQGGVRQGRGTHVWAKRHGDWRIVHEHLSGPERVEGGAFAPV